MNSVNRSLVRGRRVRGGGWGGGDVLDARMGSKRERRRIRCIVGDINFEEEARTGAGKMLEDYTSENVKISMDSVYMWFCPKKFFLVKRLECLGLVSLAQSTTRPMLKCARIHESLLITSIPLHRLPVLLHSGSSKVDRIY